MISWIFQPCLMTPEGNHVYPAKCGTLKKIWMVVDLVFDAKNELKKVYQS
jgi:hypothetical protein